MNLRILLILACLSAFGPIAIDLYLPSFSLIAEEFNSNNVQLSLSVYLIGLAIGQILYGPLTDKIGRKPPLIFGICLFSLASIGCALATSMQWLIALRLLQALGGCAGMVISRAIVRDLCEPRMAAKAFSHIMLINGLTPMLAPLLGTWLLNYFTWHASFYLCAIFAICIVVGIIIYLPETLAANAPKPPISTAFRQYLLLFKEYEFMSFSCASGFALAGLFVYIGSAHELFVNFYKLSNTVFAILFGLNALSLMLCAQLNHILLKKHTSLYWIPKVLLITLSASILLFISLYFKLPIWVFVICLMTFMGTLGILLPNLTACAMAIDARRAGSASALMGTLQFGIAATLSSLTAWLNTIAIYTTAIVLLGATIAILCIIHKVIKQQKQNITD